MDRYRFRPHHFLCTLGFQGKGYSPEFVENYKKISQKLHSKGGNQIPIEVTEQTDTICGPCPNRRENLCKQQERVESLDQAHAKILGLKDGDTLTWGDAKHLISEKMTLEKFHQACQPCGWKELGICEKALGSLKKSKKNLGIVLIAFYFALMTSSQAAPQKVHHKASFLDDLQEKIEKQRRSSRAAKWVKQIQTALEKAQFSQAKELVQKLRKEKNYLDYSYFLEGETLSQEVKRQATRGNSSGMVTEAQKAIQAYQQILAQTPGSSLSQLVSEKVALTELTIGQIYFRRKKYRESQAFYEKSFYRLQKNKKLGLIEKNHVGNYSVSCKKKTSESCTFWSQRLAKNFPERSVEFKAISRHLPMVTEETQKPYYSRFTQRYRAPDRDREDFEKAMKLYLDEEYSDAMEKFEEFLKNYPKSSHLYRAKYWLAKTWEEKGKEDQAKKTYLQILKESPFSYYGILASLSSGIKMEEFISARIPKAVAYDPWLSPREVNTLQRAEELISNGVLEYASLDLKSLKPGSSISSEFVMYLASLNHRVGNHLNAFQNLGELFQRGYDDAHSSYVLRLIFPIAFKDLIQKVAKENKVDPILVLSLMKQESAFEDAIISRSGAVGLMQLMPFTAVDVDQSVTQTDLTDPEINVSLGTQYISRVLNRFKGNIALSLAGYNAGPSRSARWQREASPKWDMFEFIESIPYEETRGYVSSIIRNYFWYTYQLTGRRMTSLDYFWGVSGPSESPMDFPPD